MSSTSFALRCSIDKIVQLKLGGFLLQTPHNSIHLNILILLRRPNIDSLLSYPFTPFLNKVACFGNLHHKTSSAALEGWYDAFVHYTFTQDWISHAKRDEYEKVRGLEVMEARTSSPLPFAYSSRLAWLIQSWVKV